jgi:hypothetical protein
LNYLQALLPTEETIHFVLVVLGSSYQLSRLKESAMSGVAFDDIVFDRYEREE